MYKFLRLFSACSLVLLLSGLVACSNSRHHGSEEFVKSPVTDSVAVEPAPEYKPVPGDSAYVFAGGQEIITYLDTCSSSDDYRGGILRVIAEEVPEYANRLIAALSKYNGFIVADKASMRVILYDRFGHVVKAYDMACAKNFGTKHKRGDSRTPEGFFTVEGRYDSTDWLFTDDNGHTSQKKGQFGPRFIRLKIPGWSQIGIHGTCSPWSMGHRTSHGCIRILNENILELVDLVEPGMPVIVLPGKKDRAVNREEGYVVPYFPTDAKYAVSEAEKRLKVKDREELEAEKKAVESDSVKETVPDSITTSASETESNDLPVDSVYF